MSQRLSIASTAVIMGLGNHERDFPGTINISPYYNTSVDSGGECGVAAITRYPMPLAAGATSAQASSWFNVSQGPLTVIMLNSELALESDTPQRLFFEAALAAVDRTVTPWRA